VPENTSVEIHHDYAVLEERLAAILHAVKARAGPLAPVAIVVPTQRLIVHLQVCLAERAGVLAAVRFFHHDGLARAIAGAAGVTLPRALGDGAREAIVAEVATRAGGELAAWMGARPGSAAALRATFDDLREAGIEARAAPDRAEGPEGRLSAGGRNILRLYERYAALLGRLESIGFSDRCGRVARAVPHAADFAARFDTIVHYGAYELTGINLDLLRGLAAAGRPLICLAPGHPVAPAFAYARGFWRRHLGVEPVTVRSDAAAAVRLLGDRLPLLYEEEARPGPAPGSFAFGHAQGPAAEIGEAVRGLLRDWRAGDGGTARRPSRLALVARTLEPYTLHMGPVFATHGLPFQSSAGLPATRQPAVQAAAWLLRCLADDFPAAVLCDLLRTGLVRAPGGGVRRPEELPRADLAERLLRDWQITGGRALIADRLPGWVDAERPTLSEAAGPSERDEAARAAAARRLEARRLAEFVRVLARAGEPLAGARRWSAWAAACADLLRRHVDGYDAPNPPPGADLVLDALADMEALDAAGLRLTPGAGAAAVARAVEGATIPIGSVAADGTPVEGDGGGVRVLDAMQARGLSFDTVVVIGMNADLFPRRPREDPFLPDDDRRLLRQAQRRPLQLASEARHEEHLLLAHLMGAARHRLVVLWQRADDEGKARTPSLALREIARLALGTPDLEGLDAAAARVSADPAARILAAVDEGLIARPEAGLAAAFACRSPGRLGAALAGADAASMLGGGVGADAAVPPGLAFLESIDGAAPTPFDALVGAPGDEPATWSPSRLETLGGCPQQFFFRHVLHIDEWEAPPEAHEAEAREMGALAHEVLRDLYAALFTPVGAADAGAGRAPASGAHGAGRIRALLEEIWGRRGAPIATRMQARYPGLWNLLGAQWLAALGEFALHDAAVVGAALEPPRLEHPAEASIPLGEGQGELRLRGRFDRLLRFADRLVVSDYKTGGRPAAFVGPAPILKGLRLQMPLYILLAERAEGGAPAPAAHPAVHAEVLGVGPAFAHDSPEDRTALLSPDRFNTWRGGFIETLAVLRDLARAGLYPLDAEPARCGRCPYARACRRHHGPTLDRLRAHPALARFRATRAKSSRSPTLASVALRNPDRSTENET